MPLWDERSLDWKDCSFCLLETSPAYSAITPPLTTFFPGSKFCMASPSYQQAAIRYLGRFSLQSGGRGCLRSCILLSNIANGLVEVCIKALVLLSEGGGYPKRADTIVWAL